jgi:hypothetical protein
MTRLEIFTNRSIEENLIEAFEKEGVAKAYSKIPIVHGVGSSGPRMGDAIWPEENTAFVIWCEEAEAEGIRRAVAAVKHDFPDEGMKLFELGGGTPCNTTGASAVHHGEGLLKAAEDFVE